MADHKYKLFSTIDPSKVNVPFNKKFAKLTLASHKKKQPPGQPEQGTKESEPKPPEEIILSENPLLRSDSSSDMGQSHTLKDDAENGHPDIEGSEYMEALQLSGDGCTQPRRSQTPVDVEALATQVTNLTMEQRVPQPEISICISSTTEEGGDDDDDDDDDSDASCITISDSSEDEAPPPESMAVSDRMSGTDPHQEPIAAPILTNDQVQRIEAFLRDVSNERREMGDKEFPMTPSPLSSARRRSRLADADTESMATTDEDWMPSRPIDSSQRLANNETELATFCSADLAGLASSKRLADDDTELNTLSSEDAARVESSSKRLADDDTEVNTLCSSDSTLNEDEPIPDVSIEIPETGSEGEPTPPRPSSSSASTSSGEEPAAIQVSSINISAKINIKIHIPAVESSSGDEEDDEPYPTPKATQSLPAAEEVYEEQPQRQQRQEEQHQKSMLATNDASEDEQFLTQAENLLNQLYGKAWQTPDVIRTLKRSSGGSGGKTPHLKPKNFQVPTAVTTVKKKKERRPAPRVHQPNESLLADFSQFKRTLHSNQTPLNSTRLPQRAVQTERRPRAASPQSKRKPQRKPQPTPRTNHVDEDRWRALVDTDSGTDASDDEDADATFSDTESSSDAADDNNGKGDITYLDLSKDEVEVISDPDEDAQSSKTHRRLDDILRSCRAATKTKLPATPIEPSAEIEPATPTVKGPTRRRLFRPNIGYETEKEAIAIVSRAQELDMLDELEDDYLPGTPVHKRLQEVKKNMGIVKKTNATPEASPILKLLAPKTAIKDSGKAIKDSGKASARQLKEQLKRSDAKCSFLKSLEGAVPRECSDKEALFYRENFAKNKEQLAERLYKMFNADVFNNELDVPITWSKRLRNTAGRCLNKRKSTQRLSTIELSVKVLTTADRLRCTLIHELCHAATWVFNSEGGHGRVWKNWAQRANKKYPDLPAITVCHSYSIDFKYTYRCVNCNLDSNAHSRSRKVEYLRCRKCQGKITLLLNKKDKHGNIVSQPAGEAKGFAKFVKDNFKKYKQANVPHKEVMTLLSAAYAKQKDQEEKQTTASLATLTLDD
ncbi:uncharacterized protein LOC117580732 isoform X1 [Drosophila guanche]|uniref:Blast:Acidic repeat-containing protein n=1 Tax=Drosophila guanche TaxID=7266 RepID=A0A3B0JYH3_DROGU|nr:uncharacterized protein LOC117580732 isoform X1 [Drosophila guanche]SPP78426.1 blast:Acidic repeat-containing protein [Drosophila guanche]